MKYEKIFLPGDCKKAAIERIGERATVSVLCELKGRATEWRLARLQDISSQGFLCMVAGSCPVRGASHAFGYPG
jgi:hypothetical protein